MNKTLIIVGVPVVYKWGDHPKNGEYTITDVKLPDGKFEGALVSIDFVMQHPDRFEIGALAKAAKKQQTPDYDSKAKKQPIPAYDSKADTLEHIRNVNGNLLDFAMQLMQRAKVHDQSKLEEPEKSIMDGNPYKLENMVYMDENYIASREYIKPALDHHYSVNTHHPEHYKDGLFDMTLMDIVEMYCDWKAATARTKNGGTILAQHQAMNENKKRFGINDQLHAIFINTLYKDRE